jgi:hypothetical protein
MATAPTVPYQADVAPTAAEPSVRKDPVVAAAACLLVVLLAGLLPVWALSVQTPLRLIDDYGASFELWDKPLREHLASNLLIRENEGRFRPTYDLGQWIAFGLFGADYRGHHALRLLVKVLGFAALLAVAFRRVEGSSGTRLGPRERLVLATLAFSLFFYFPNNPEARLTPQELPTVTYFMGCLFFLTRRPAGAASTVDDVLGLACFAVGLWSKEPNVIPGAVLLALVFVEQAARRRHPQTLAVLLAYAVVWVHATLKVAVLSVEGGYGRSTLAWRDALTMVHELPRQGLLGATAPWLPVVFAFGLASFVWLGIGRAASRALRLRSALLLCLLLSSVAGYVLLWSPVLRYAYPTTALVVLLSVIGFGLLLARAPSEQSRRRRSLATAVIGLAFALTTYRDMTAQFSTQYVAGWTETAMLARVERLMSADPGRSFFAVWESEYDRRVGIYFNRHLPYFTGRRTRIGVVRDHAQVPVGADWVTRRTAAKGFVTLLEMPPVPEPRILAISTELSRMMRLGRPLPEPILDAGAPLFEAQPWFILRRTDPPAAFRPPAGARP